MNYLSDHGRRLLFELERQNYLIIVDYYSKFFELLHFPNINGKTVTVINHVKSHLARYGIPEVIVCDNGPEFDSSEFKMFAEHY